MRNIIMLFVAVLVFASCAKKHETVEEAYDEWKEMDDFHLIMADVYHPLKDSGNLEPIKTQSAELAAAAETWANAAVPEKVNNDEVKGLLQKLKDGTKDLDAKIKSGQPDDATSAQLTELHEVFHHVQEKWYEGGEAGAEEHHDHH